MIEGDDYGPDDLIPLAKAAKLLFRGALTKSSLRTEARKGNLEIIQVANKDFVTKNGIKGMIEKCRKSENRQGSGSDQIQAPGSSRTETSASPRSAAKLRLRQLRESLPNTSTANTGRSAAVVPLKSR
ncbi:hypothetical protein EFR84_11210 [Rhizobium chutanense]|uniref:Uncharacterized protein n=1 Tax=Rhizobium chutanense TaxID=2035448 RepID=A0A3S0R1D3_9HYPH|nr:hypothetical protein EFR84_11210 [Rhizobium chutanense]